MKKTLALFVTAAMLTACLPAATAAETLYTPGTYMATVEGFGGGITVAVDLSENRIDAITADAPYETTGIGDMAIEAMTLSILDEQTPYVDVVSGATITSRAFGQAVEDAMIQGGLVPDGEFAWNSASPAPSYDWETVRAQRIHQYKVDQGMPFLDGVNVSLNGKYLDFGGVAPLGGAYDAQVPFRAFLEGFGAKVSYQDGKLLAVMPDGMSIMAAMDSTNLTYTVGDKLETELMSSTPTIMSGVSYVDLSAMALALGLGVYQDSYYDVVRLTDWAAAVAEADASLTAFNSYLAAARAAVDPAKTYSTKSTFTMSGTLYGDEKPNTATMTYTGQGLTGPDGSSLDQSFHVDLGTLYEPIRTLSGMDKDEMDAWIKEVNTARCQLISTPTDAYQKGSLPTLSPYTVVRLPSDVWLHSTVGSETEAIRLDSFQTMGELLGAYCKVIYGSYSDGYETFKQMTNAVSLLVGDDVLTTKTSGSTTTWSVDMDLKALLARGDALFGSTEPTTVEDIAASLGSTPDFRFTLSAKAQSGKLTSTELSFHGALDGAFPVTLDMKLSGTPLSMKGSASVKGGYLGKLEVTMQSNSSVTTQKIPTAPPAGESVKELEDAFNDLWNSKAALTKIVEVAKGLVEQYS